MLDASGQRLYVRLVSASSERSTAPVNVLLFFSLKSVEYPVGEEPGSERGVEASAPGP